MTSERTKIANSFTLPRYPFLHGISRLLDFGGLLNRDTFAQVLERSDADSIGADWQAVGNNMRWAIAEYEREMREQGFRDSRIAS